MSLTQDTRGNKCSYKQKFRSDIVTVCKAYFDNNEIGRELGMYIPAILKPMSSSGKSPFSGVFMKDVWEARWRND